MDDKVIICRKCGAKNRVMAAKQHLEPKCGKCREPLDLSGINLGPAELSDANFDTFLASTDRPVMVDFYSPTCGPCKSMMPVVDRMAGRYRGRALIAKINSSVNMAAASRFGIRGVPTFIFFRSGREIDRLTGAAPEEMLASKLDSLT